MVLTQLNNDKKVIDWIHNFFNKKEIILRITKICNQKCFFCFTKIDNKTFPTFNEIIVEIDNVINNNLWSKLDFVITWWEPTTHKNFLDIISYIYNKWHQVTIQSNAVNFANNDLVNSLKNISEDINFFISFHSHIEKVYNYITNTNKQYEFAVKWISLLINNFDNVVLNIVINKLNLNFLKLYFNFIWKAFFSLNNKISLNISVMSNIYKYNNINKTLVKYSDLVNIINESKIIINDYNIKIWVDFWWPCDLPFCLWKKLFYYNEKFFSSREESDRYIDRKKINNCMNCKYINNCSWILKLYLDKFWESEFNSIN